MYSLFPIGLIFTVKTLFNVSHLSLGLNNQRKLTACILIDMQYYNLSRSVQNQSKEKPFLAFSNPSVWDISNHMFTQKRQPKK